MHDSGQANRDDSASSTPTDIHEYSKESITVTWEPSRCWHAAECVRGLPHVFNPKRRPWIELGDASADELVAVIDRCPSFALGYRTTDGRHREAPIEP